MSNNNNEILNAHGRSIALAIGFFTRLPTPFLSNIQEGDMGRVLYYLPLAGLLIGLVSAGAGFLLLTGLDAWAGYTSLYREVLVGIITFTLLVVLTGGLHLDGLADSADAWVGGLGDKQRTLDIMKDPTSGPIAVAVLILLLIIKAAAVTILVLQKQWLLVALIPMLSRTAGVALYRFTEYTRPNGMGKEFADVAKRPACTAVLATAIAFPLLLTESILWLPLALTFVLWIWLRKQSIARLGGFTGDIAGAVIELTEVSLFILTALLLA